MEEHKAEAQGNGKGVQILITKERAIAMIDEYLLEPNSIDAEWVECLRMSREALRKHEGWQQRHCTGERCPMQIGFNVSRCKFEDCIYRTEEDNG